jgi:hypothetical protein
MMLENLTELGTAPPSRETTFRLSIAASVKDHASLIDLVVEHPLHVGTPEKLQRQEDASHAPHPAESLDPTSAQPGHESSSSLQQKETVNASQPTSSRTFGPKQLEDQRSFWNDRSEATVVVGAVDCVNCREGEGTLRHCVSAAIQATVGDRKAPPPNRHRESRGRPRARHNPPLSGGGSSDQRAGRSTSASLHRSLGAICKPAPSRVGRGRFRRMRQHACLLMERSERREKRRRVTNRRTASPCDRNARGCSLP